MITVSDRLIRKLRKIHKARLKLLIKYISAMAIESRITIDAMFGRLQDLRRQGVTGN